MQTEKEVQIVTRLEIPLEHAKLLLEFLELAPVAKGTKTFGTISAVIAQLKIALPNNDVNHGALPDT